MSLVCILPVYICNKSIEICSVGYILLFLSMEERDIQREIPKEWRQMSQLYVQRILLNNINIIVNVILHLIDLSKFIVSVKRLIYRVNGWKYGHILNELNWWETFLRKICWKSHLYLLFFIWIFFSLKFNLNLACIFYRMSLNIHFSYF